MAGAKFTTAAEQDIQQIAEYIARDNIDAALAWVDDVRTTCDLIATQPAVGQRMQTVQFGEVRRHVVGRYLVYYRPEADGITVVRLLHGAREQTKNL